MAIFKNELVGVDAIIEAVNKKVENYNPTKEWFIRCVSFEGLPAKRNSDNVWVAQKSDLMDWISKNPGVIPKRRAGSPAPANKLD